MFAVESKIVAPSSSYSWSGTAAIPVVSCHALTILSARVWPKGDGGPNFWDVVSRRQTNLCNRGFFTRREIDERLVWRDH